MLLDIVTKGATDRSVTIRIIDDTDGTPETGVLYDTASIDLKYRREGGAVVSIEEAELSTPAIDDAHADGGFIHLGAGYYRLDLPDAAFATGANHVDVFGTVPDMVVIGGRVRLTDFDLEDGDGTGLTEAGGDGDHLTEAGGTGDQLSAVPWNADWDAEVQSEVADGLAAYDPPTKAELDSGLAGLNDPTAGAVADAVWDEAKAGHVGSGSFGEEVQAHALSSEVDALENLSAAEVNAEVDTALADYDGPTNAEMEARTLPAADYFDPTTDEVDVGSVSAAAIQASSFAAGALDAAALASDAVAELVTGLLAGVVEGSVTVRESLALSNAAAAGKITGAATTTVTLRNLADDLDRIEATVDEDGNRSAVTRLFTDL